MELVILMKFFREYYQKLINNKKIQESLIMKKITIVLFIAISLLACKKDKDDNIQDSKQQNKNITIQNKTEQYLFIEGNQIWLRETPSRGKVVMKLDNGTKCKLLEKGKKETIKGLTDYWYKIEYNGKQAWVFGSQTNLKSQNNNSKTSLTKTEIDSFVKRLLKISSPKQTEFKNFFVNDSLYELYNPGVFLVVTKINYKELFDKNISIKSFSKSGGDIIYDKEPQFDMDTYEWKDRGLFINKNHTPNVLSRWLTIDIDDDNPTYTKSLSKEVKKNEKLISHKLTITVDDGIIIYFGKINNEIKIIAIDISSNDA